MLSFNGSEKSSSDRRFHHPLWAEHPFFSAIKQLYEASIAQCQQALECCPFLDQEDKDRLTFYSQGVWDSLCPANYPWLNPTIWEETIRSRGQNWARGIDYWHKSQRGEDFYVPLSSAEAHQVGKTLAVTQGIVLARTELFELLYYPAGSEVRSPTLSPVLIIPSWINKFYIFDLTPETSFIAWACSQGIPIFVLSWVNPCEIREVGLAEYVHAVLKAFSLIYQLSSLAPHLIGHCAGGILMTYAALYLTKTQKILPASLTYLTHIFDFRHMGNWKYYLELFKKQGSQEILTGNLLREVFLSLRPRDIFWPSVIDRYYLGKEGSSLPIFYWNDDPMNVFPRLHQEFIQMFCEENVFVQDIPWVFEGIELKISELTVPSFILAALKDHIVPWLSCYAGTNLIKGPCEFVLTESGHVAGVVNHPSAHKYGYFTKGLAVEPKAWCETAHYSSGSWWPYWGQWIKSYSLMSSSSLWDAHFPSLGNTPGNYVRIQYRHNL